VSEDSVEKLTFLALGWLLGLVAPVIVDAIKRRRENKLGRLAMTSELRELGCMLSTAAYGARMRIGTADRRFLEWLKNDLEHHASTAELQAFLPNLSKQLSWTDDELKAVAAHMSAEDGKGTMLQKYLVPVLDTRVAALWSFETSFQRELLAIRQHLGLLDDIVDRSRKYFDMTFTKLEEDNYRLVTENLEQCYSLYAERAERIVTMIRKLANAAQ